MDNTRQLEDGVELVKEDIFWPEGNWSIRRGEFVWSKTEGWLRYYDKNRGGCIFKTAEEALAAWENSKG